MKFASSLQSYIKGDFVKTDNYVENTETNKCYWFDNSMEEDPWLPKLDKTQRVMGFFLFLLLGIFCFVLAGLLTPVLVLKLRKFALLYTMGSVFVIGSFSMLWGPWNHLQHICSTARLPFTFLYFGAMFSTLYAAISLRSTPLTLVFASCQIVSFLWYIFSYLPGGTTGLKFFAKIFASMCTKTVSRTLPI